MDGRKSRRVCYAGFYIHTDFYGAAIFNKFGWAMLRLNGGAAMCYITDDQWLSSFADGGKTPVK